MAGTGNRTFPFHMVSELLHYLSQFLGQKCSFRQISMKERKQVMVIVAKFYHNENLVQINIAVFNYILFIYKSNGYEETV